MENRSVLYLLYDGLTEPLGQSQVLSYLKGLCNKGYQFTIISFEKRKKFKEFESDIRDLTKDYPIEWHPLVYHKSPPVLSTLFDIFNMKSKAEELIKKERFELVHCRSYIASIIGSFLNKKYQLPFVFDMRGFFADERVDGGIWNLRNPLYNLVYKYFKKREKYWIENSDHVITLTKSSAGIIKEHHPKAELTVIPCCVDKSRFKPNIVPSEVSNLLREKLGIKPNEFVLLYHGSVGSWYLLPEMMQFYSVLKTEIPGSKFVILTRNNKEYINNEAIKHEIDPSDIIVASVPFANIPAYLSIANAGVFFIKACFSKKASSPTKLAEFLAMEIPVFTNKGVGDIEDILSPTTYGYLIDEFSKSTYKIAIRKYLKQDKKKIYGMHKFAMENFDVSVGVARYYKVYEDILASTIDNTTEYNAAG